MQLHDTVLVASMESQYTSHTVLKNVTILPSLVEVTQLELNTYPGNYYQQYMNLGATRIARVCVHCYELP